MIIATLLLIAIAIAAGIIVYVFVNSLAGGLTAGGGQQTAERLQMQAFNFALTPGACTTGQILELFILNSGSVATTISAVYFDGALLTAGATPTGASQTLVNLNYFIVPASVTVTACTTGPALTFSAAGSLTEPIPAGPTGTGAVYIVWTAANAPTAGTAHTVKVVSSTGATYVFSVSAGRTG